MGEAAGIAAAQAATSGGQVRSVDLPQVQAELLRRGAYLGATHAAAQ